MFLVQPYKQAEGEDPALMEKAAAAINVLLSNIVSHEAVNSRKSVKRGEKRGKTRP